MPTCDREFRKYFLKILETISSMNKFLSGLYHADVWLSPEECASAIATGRAFLDGFRFCADHAFLVLNSTRWKYQPKYHLFGEIVFKLEQSHRAKCPCLNPIIESTQVDEDFVGRIARFSTSVSIRKISERTLKKYLLSLAGYW